MGVRLGKVEKGKGYGQNNHLLPPLPHNIEQRRGCTGRPAGGGARGTGDPVCGDGQEVGKNEEELEGNRFLSLPWSGTYCGGRATAGGGAARGGGCGGTGGGDGGLRKEGKLVVEVRGEVGSRSSPFIGAGRSVWQGYFELRGAPMAGNGGSGKIPAWILTGGILSRLAAV
jgi:hypothetical protein